MATVLAMTIPFEKNICNSVGKVLKRLLPFNPTPAEIDTAAMRKLCSLCSKSTRAKIYIPCRETKPNMTSIAPPRTGLGIICANAPNLGKRPSKMRNPAA